MEYRTSSCFAYRVYPGREDSLTEATMRTDPSARRAQLDAWQTENLRVTAFVDGKSDISKNRWLEDLLGDDVVRIQDNRTSGVRVEVVSFAHGKIALQTMPSMGAIHWTFVDTDDATPESPRMNFVDSLEPFSELMQRWFHLCSGVHRLAFGCVLRLPVPDRETGYRKMSDYMTFNLDDGSFDFSYQINRPRLFSGIEPAVEPIRINRLARWSVGMTFVVGITPARNLPSPISSYCRLELDLNTPPESQDVLSSTSLCSIYDELVRLGSELVREGDVK
jgi:hypothetical protein